MRALIMDAEARDTIKRVVAYADGHRVTLAELRRIVTYPALAPGNMASGFTCHIPSGYRCTFSFEEQPPAPEGMGGWCRHLSVSVDDPEFVPAPAAVGMLAQEFGYSRELVAALTGGAENEAVVAGVWLEDFGPAGRPHRAVNIVEREAGR